MAHLGHPILGDMKYGNKEENNYWFRRGIKRPLLHAYKLVFSDMGSYASSSSPEALQAPVPGDMKNFFRKKGWKVDVTE
jgi:23S rRNA pseudouridine955/2504/2580 synthase